MIRKFEIWISCENLNIGFHLAAESKELEYLLKAHLAQNGKYQKIMLCDFTYYIFSLCNLFPEKGKFRNNQKNNWKKGKWPYAVVYDHIDLYSHQERASGRGGEHLRWQIESLVTCVPRLLQEVVAFSLISRPTVEARDTIVHSATSHLGHLNIWRGTSSFTLGRNRTSAHNATFQPIRLLT